MKKKNSKSSREKKRRVRILIYILIGIIFFAAGLLTAPLLEEKWYQVKEWFTEPSPLPQEMREVKLYFSSAAGDRLVPEKRKIIASSQIGEEADQILKELIKGPENSSLNPTLPSETKIRGVYTKEGCFYVDFSSSLKEKHSGGSTGELLTIYSIVNTLLDNFPSQSQVQILIEGEPVDTLAGHIDIRNPLSKDL